MSWKTVNKSSQIGRITMEIESLKAELEPDEFCQAMEDVIAWALFQQQAVAKKMGQAK